MKTLKYFLLIFIIFFITPVYADKTKPEIYDDAYVPIPTLVQSEDLNVMCIYNDGMSITKGYDDIAKTVYATLKTYPVRNTKTLEENVSKQKLLGCSEGSCTNISGYKLAIANKLSYECPEVMYRWLVSEYIKDTGKQLVLYYYHETTLESGQTVEKRLESNRRWYLSGEYENRVLSIENGTKYQKIDLVAEQITYRNGITTKNSCTYAYKSKQGNNRYITLYGYSGRIYLDNDVYMTKINNFNINNSNLLDIVNNQTCDKKAPKVCVKLSEQKNNTNNEYEFTQQRHEVIKPSNDSSCSEGYVLYEFTNYDSDSVQNAESLQQICDRIPNTAIVLSKILSYIQIIVPALVIVYTGIDIGKIVLAGNVEEELPKRKKSIIIRLIVMVVFFFAPIIIQVIMGEIYGTDVGAVDCLYQNNVENENSKISIDNNEKN